jgi:hypothetical protein
MVVTLYQNKEPVHIYIRSQKLIDTALYGVVDTLL